MYGQEVETFCGGRTTFAAASNHQHHDDYTVGVMLRIFGHITRDPTRHRDPDPQKTE